MVLRSRTPTISAKTVRMRRSKWCSIVIVSFLIFLVFFADLQLAEQKTYHFLCKIEKEPEPVIVEDFRVLALSLTNNIRLRCKK